VSAERSSRVGCAALLFAAVVFFLLFSCAFVPHALPIVWAIVTGPWSYPAFVFPRAHANPSAIATAGVAAIAMAIGSHSLARWLHRARAGAEAPWKPRWTLAALAMLVLTFAVAVDVAAVVHQTAWLATAPPKSVVYDRYRDGPGFELSPMCHALGDEPRLREVQAQTHRNGTAEHWDIDIVRRKNGTAGGVLFRARDPRNAFAGRVFTCDGMVSEAEAEEYVSRIESSDAS
jgi:hypothetical protein